MFAYIPIIYCFFPETAGRTLEQMDFLFASRSPFTWDEEKEFAKRMTQFEAEIQKMEVEGRLAGGEKTGSGAVECLEHV
jgi:hypothetical protein